MTLSKRKDAGIWERKNQSSLSGEIGFEEAMGLSQDRLRNDWHAFILKAEENHEVGRVAQSV
jgi:hypothetical protein